MTKTIRVKTRARCEFVNITSDVQKIVHDSGITSGICSVYAPHTTAGITINEGADPSVEKDIQGVLSRLVPHSAGYSHSEGNSDAHVKSTLVGSSQSIIIEGGKLLLGTWQAIFFCEFDGARTRSIMVHVQGE